MVVSIADVIVGLQTMTFLALVHNTRLISELKGHFDIIHKRCSLYTGKCALK